MRQGCDDVAVVAAACDQGGVPVDRSVPDPARLVVTGIAWPEELSSELDSRLGGCAHARNGGTPSPRREDQKMDLLSRPSVPHSKR
jgi:hypothetical protein